MGKPSKAVLAMQSVIERSSTNQPMNEAIGTFVEALRETNPDRVFTVIDITAWATEYIRLEGEVTFPDELFNAYSLGRYLKASFEVLGIEPQGTYGNRQVWGLKND